VSLDGPPPIQHGVEHPNPEIEHGQGPDAPDPEAHAPDGAEVRLVAGSEHNQEDRDGERPAEREREVRDHDECRAAAFQGELVGRFGRGGG